MAFDTYENLKTAIIEELDRDDLASKVDDFIDLAEARHKRDIRIREAITRAPITIDSEYVNLPSGFNEGIGLTLLTSPRTVLAYKSPYEIDRVKREGTGKPQAFTILGTEFEFDVAPDSAYNGRILYYAKETPLSDSNSSNNILERAPDAYFYAALLASAPHLMNDERIPVWAGLYREAVEGLSNQRRQERHMGPLVATVAGSTP